MVNNAWKYINRNQSYYSDSDSYPGGLYDHAMVINQGNILLFGGRTKDGSMVININARRKRLFK